MISRALKPSLETALGTFPVVALVGARQVGKTTLAKEIAQASSRATLVLDLERPSDLAKLRDPELYLERHLDKLVVIDEVQRQPGLFPLLRALVDAERRPGRFLLLGSASPELTQGASESLAGRIDYLELGPLTMAEVGTDHATDLWLRGGFPEAFLAPNLPASEAWRAAFIRTYLERDIPTLGLRLPPSQLGRFWQMVAHCHGQLWNGSDLASGLGLSLPTMRRYLDILQDTFMVRQLQPWAGNLGKRLVKRPKVYLRDSGLLHSLLGIGTAEDLFGHPSVGASWEGFVIEQVLAAVPATWKPYFFRTSAGAELDLVLVRPGNLRPLGIEIKLTKTPVPSKGFWSALQDLDAQGVVLCACQESYPLGGGVLTMPIQEIGRLRDYP